MFVCIWLLEMLWLKEPGTDCPCVLWNLWALFLMAYICWLMIARDAMYFMKPVSAALDGLWLFAYGWWIMIVCLWCSAGLCLLTSVRLLMVVCLWLLVYDWWLLVVSLCLFAYGCLFMVVYDVVLINYCSVMNQKTAVGIDCVFIWTISKEATEQSQWT